MRTEFSSLPRKVTSALRPAVAATATMCGCWRTTSTRLSGRSLRLRYSHQSPFITQGNLETCSELAPMLRQLVREGLVQPLDDADDAQQRAHAHPDADGGEHGAQAVGPQRERRDARSLHHVDAKAHGWPPGGV